MKSHVEDTQDFRCAVAVASARLFEKRTQLLGERILPQQQQDQKKNCLHPDPGVCLCQVSFSNFQQ